MTVREAIRQTQKKDAGFVNQISARYAQELIRQTETILGAVVANITAKKEKFPGVVVLTNQRVMAVCGLPGIKRAVIFALDEIKKCEEKSLVLEYSATFYTATNRFRLSVNPEVGERFSRCLAVMNGTEDEFDSVKADAKGKLLSPVFLRNRMRKQRSKEKEIIMQQEARNAANAQTGDCEDFSAEQRQEMDIKSTASLLNQQLEEAKERGIVSDTDPRAVAVRLAEELAANTGTFDRC